MKSPKFGCLLIACMAGAGSHATPARGAFDDSAEPSRIVVDVNEFGARADGMTDCAAAIQRAIDRVSRNGGRVVFRAAKKPYVIRRSLVIRSNGVELNGPGATVLLAGGAGTSGTVDCVEIRGTPDNEISSVTVRGLTIDANYWNQPGAYRPRGIDCDWASGVRIENVTIKRAWVGLTFGLGTHHCEARGCVATQWHNDAFNASGDGVTGSCHHIKFERCRAIDSPDDRDGGLEGRRNNAWEIEDGCADIEVQDCVVEHAGGNAFAVRNHAWPKPVLTGPVHFSRCAAKKVAGRGWYVRGADGRVTVDGVALEECTSDADCAFSGGIRSVALDRGNYAAPVLIGQLRDVKKPPARPGEVLDIGIARCRLKVLKVNLPSREKWTAPGSHPLTLSETSVGKTFTVYGDRKGVLIRECRLPEW